jgi:oligopeptide transport system substrate-binding protein
MKRSLRGFFLIAILAGVIVGAIACSGGKSDSGGGDPLKPADKGSGTATRGDADLSLLGGDPITLDPALAGDAGSATYIVELYSGLVTLDKDLKLQPDLAESWQVSPDGTVYTFKLRKNAQFHDGKPVTADDFKYSLDRAAKLGQTTSPVAEAFLGDIVGAKDVTRGRADSISGVKVIDGSTLQITIDAPKSFFLAKLTYPTAFVVDKAQVDSNPRNWTRKPNGTGPYKMVEWRLNERIILAANDRFYNGAPAVKRVVYNLAGGSSLTQYENNEVDVSGISINDIERVQSSRDPLSKDYVTGPNLSVNYIAFNTKVAPFDDPKVRQAFAMAIDRDQIARVVLKNLLPVANSIMMPGLPGYDQNAKALPFDPTGAKAALAESKYKDPKGLGTITMTEVGGGASAGFDTQAILEMLKQNLGVDVTIAQTEAAAFFDDLDRGKLQMWSTGWIMDYPDPEDIIDLLFYSKSRKNESHYENPAFDAMVEQARIEQDVTKRLKEYQDAEKVLINDAVWIPLYFGKDHVVVKPYVKGYFSVPIVIPFLKYLSIQK